MKKITLFFLVSLFSSSLVRAQTHTIGNLWGIFTYDQLLSYNTLIPYDSSVYTFQGGTVLNTVPSNPLYGGLIQDTDGNFYGLTNGGGSIGYGTIFKCTPTGIVTTIYAFNANAGADGSNPYGSLIIGRDGNFYGMTNLGGANNSGTIFEWNKATAKETVLYSFGTNTNDGANPFGDLTLAKNGNFYGMTQSGGANGAGVIFEWNPTTSETVLYSFGTNANDGANPYGNLIQAKDGNLYGLTNGGGVNGAGAIFKWDTLAAAETVLYGFGTITSDGANPQGTLLQATDGDFYGVTNSGGKYTNGTIFKFNTTSLTEDTLYSFVGGTNDGQNPLTEKLLQAAGNLYGTTTAGGTNSVGTVFKWNMTLLAETVVYNFGVTEIPADGQNPTGSLIQGIDGDLYGNTANGGVASTINLGASCGVVFKCSTSGTEAIAGLLGSTKIGDGVQASVIQAKDGNFYGMGEFGGDLDEGVIFKCTPGGKVTTVYSFIGGTSDGQNPYGNLVQGTDGNFYGMTNNGGTYGDGVIFEWNPTTATETVLYSFAGGSDGQNPIGSLMQATDGNFYGMTEYGGAAGDGTIFEWSPTTATETVLYSFVGGADAGSPIGSLLQADDGNLYGANSGTGNIGPTATYPYGASTAGAIFEWNMTSKTFTALWPFITQYPATDVNGSLGSLIQAKNGLLYGMAQSGGSNNAGGIFSWNITTATESIVYNFGATLTDGNSPHGDLLQASDGNLYGFTAGGGKYNYGTIFKYDTLAQTEDTLQSFYLPYGSGPNPGNGSLIEALSTKAITSCSSTALLESKIRGGKDPYTYKWSNGGTASSISVTTPGSYSVVVTDAKGITASDSIVYSTATKLISVTTGSGITICNGSPAGLSALGSGGTGAIKYSWLPGPLSGAMPSVSPTATTTYTVTAKDVNGCTITNNQIVTVNQATVSSLSQTACELYNLNGTDYTATGTYIQHLTNKLGCDSTLTLNLLVNEPTVSTITKTVCNSYILNGATYATSGTYTQIIPNKIGCDSTITLNLTITGGVTSNLTETACGGYSLNGSTYTSSGTYTQNLTSKGGCDSTLTLNLTITKPTTSILAESHCNSYLLNGITYTSSGTFTQSLTNKAGCDSTLTLNLTITGGVTSSFTETACDGYSLNGSKYTSTGTYTQNLTSKEGCDSTLTLNLTITNSTTSNIIKATCDSGYTINGSTYNATGTYIQNITNKAGCDSTLTINLTIHPLPTVGITGTSNIALGSNDVLTGTGAISFIWSDGSTNDTANVMPLVNTTYTVTGTDGNGCKDTASFKVSVGGPTGISGIISSDKTILYPNPTISTINLSFEMQGAREAAAIKIIDAMGREIINENTTIGNGKAMTIDVSSLAQGMYFVRVITDEGTQVVKFIKQ